MTYCTIALYYQVISRRKNSCLPSAEDTDITELYQHHLTKSHDPVVTDEPVISHDPTQSSHDPTWSSHNPTSSSHDPTWSTHDSELSHNPITQASHEPIGSHDMDTLMASLSVFDTTHLGRLGTAVSMETSMTIIMLLLLYCWLHYMSAGTYGDSLDDANTVLDQG